MKYKIIILLLLATLKGFGQPDTIRKNDPPQQIVMRHSYSSAKPEDPLFVLDGKFITEKEFKNLKSEMIESVTIMKDTAATNLFGGKARNGVIIIKTKKFSKRELNKMKRKSKDS